MEPIPPIPAWIIGGELEEYAPLLPLAVSLYERSSKGDSNGGIIEQFEYGPTRRLVEVYKKTNRSEEARQLVLKSATKKTDYGVGNAQYAAQMNVQQLNSCAQLLIGLGYPADSVRLYTELLGDTEALQAAAEWNGSDWITQSAQNGLRQALDGNEFLLEGCRKRSKPWVLP